jgi:hypothetical protein
MAPTGVGEAEGGDLSALMRTLPCAPRPPPPNLHPAQGLYDGYSLIAPAAQALTLADIVNNLNIGSDIEDLVSALVPSPPSPNDAGSQEVGGPARAQNASVVGAPVRERLCACFCVHVRFVRWACAYRVCGCAAWPLHGPRPPPARLL